jgi:pilus assembly protein CpaF
VNTTKSLKQRVRERLIAAHKELFSGGLPDEEVLRQTMHKLVIDAATGDFSRVSPDERDRIVKELVEEILGYGPIDLLMRDPTVTEIMINGPKQVYVEKGGRTLPASVHFDDENQLRYLVYKMLAPTRRHVDESFPYTDVSLPDGSRVNIIIPPLALNGQVVTIRKFLKEIGTIDDLVTRGTLDANMAQLLVAAIKAKLNILFSGATGAGKTTTLNVLSSYIANDERIVTIEDTAELRLVQEHVVRLEAKQANIEGKGDIGIRELFRNSLRMRPDRIIVGEVRGAEALDMLQAICSGHRGSLAVLHANSPDEVIYRLETRIMTSGIPLTLEAIHRQIASGVNLIVQQEQLGDGQRKITHITQVAGLKNNQTVLEDIFVYEVDRVDEEGRVHGHWRATGVPLAFLTQMKKAGVHLPPEVTQQR